MAFNRFLVAVVGVGSISCGAGSHGHSTSPAREEGEHGSCTVVRLGTAPLETADGLRIYAYPSIVDMDSSGATLVLDEEVAAFRPSADGGWQAARVELLGAIVPPDGDAILVEAPVPPRRIRNLKVASRGNARWSVVFAEEDPESEDAPIRYWHGVVAPSGWSPLERVPVPTGVDLMLDEGSMVITSTELVWAIPHRRSISSGTGRMAILRRTADGWRQETLLLPTPAYASLVAEPGRLTFALVHPDTTLRQDGNSLFLHEIEGTRHRRRKIAASQAGNVHDPTLAKHENGLLLTWLAESSAGSSTGRRAFVADGRFEDTGSGEGMLIDSVTTSVRAFAMGEDALIAVTESAEALGHRHLRFYEIRGTTVSQRAATPLPFVSDAGLDAADSTFVAVGGVLTDDRRVAWLELLYFRFRCS